MAYNKQNFTKGQVLEAEHLNNIEAGIVANEEAIAEKQPKGNYATEEFVAQKVAEAQLGGEAPDMTGYLTETESDGKYQPKGDYLTEHQKIKTINGQSLVGTGNIVIEANADIPEETISSAVEEWLEANPDATTTVGDGTITNAKLADGAVSYEKADAMLKKVVDFFGKQEITWTTGKKLNAGNVAAHAYGAVSSPVYFNAGDKFTYLKTNLAYRYAYYGEDGSAYVEADSGLGSWVRSTKTLVKSGYYRFWIEYSPTSTTNMNSETLATLLESFELKSSALLGLDGTAIFDGSIPAEKLDKNCYTSNLTRDSIFRQAPTYALHFAKGFTPSATNKGIQKEAWGVCLADMYRFSTTAYPSAGLSYNVTVPTASEGSLVTGSRSDICVVKDELWVFGVAADDNSTYAPVWRIKYDPVTNTLLETPKFFWHNWGHCNAVNYNPVTDCLLLGNGSADYKLANAAYIICNVTDIYNSATGAVFDYKTQGIKIDMSGYDFGAKLNVFWTNHKTRFSSYDTKSGYLPITAFAYADDVNKMHLVTFGRGTSKFQYGTYVEATGTCPWNGTFNVIATYQIGDENETIGNPGSYDHCGQGGDAFDGKAFIGLGHSAFWWTEISLASATKFHKKDTWLPNINYGTGAISNGKTEGIAVTNDYLIVMDNGVVYYLPR